MQNYNPEKISCLCEMLKQLRDSKELAKNYSKKAFGKVEKIILKLFEFETLDEAIIESAKSNIYEEVVSWCLKKISSDPEIFNVINQLPFILEGTNKMDLEGLVKTIRANTKKESKNNNKQVEESLCILVLLDVLTFSCDNPDAIEKQYEEEINVLIKNGLYSPPHKNLFFLLVFCAQIINCPFNEQYLVVESFNKDLYYAASITYLNSLSNEVHKTSLENREKTQNFYSKILEIVGLLIAIFSIIGVNCFTLSSQTNIDVFDIVIVNSTVVLSIVIILFLIHNIIHNSSIKKYIVIMCVSFLSIIIAIILLLIKVNILIIDF